MRGSTGIDAGAGLFSAQGQLFTGGPAEGWLQKTSPPARLVALVVITAVAAFTSNPVILAALSCLALATALVSYLDLPSILKLTLLPLVVLAAPSWLVAVAFFHVPLSSAGVGLLRVWCSVEVAMVILHSLGLMNMAPALRRLGLPLELCTAWRMMVAQASGFSELSSEMELARRARHVTAPDNSIMRQLIGGQMGILLARMWHKSSELAMAMDARKINDYNAAGCRTGVPTRLDQPGQQVDKSNRADGPAYSKISSALNAAQTDKRHSGRAGVSILQPLTDLPLFQIINISHEFTRDEIALEHISAEIKAGGCTALLGCNGAGKSTLLHLLAGLLTPTAGQILWHGEDVSAVALKRDPDLRAQFRQTIGIAFQDPDCQWLCDTVQQETEFGPMQIWPAQEARERADQAMVTMGVNHLANRAPFTLSGGQKRRVALASVIAMNPDVLLLDEPTLSLDAATTDFLLDWLQEFLAAGDKTLILTTHDLDLVHELAHQAIVLTPCHKLARCGPVEEILQDHNFLQQMNLAGRRGRSLLY